MSDKLPQVAYRIQPAAESNLFPHSQANKPLKKVVLNRFKYE